MLMWRNLAANLVRSFHPNPGSTARAASKETSALVDMAIDAIHRTEFSSWIDAVGNLSEGFCCGLARHSGVPGGRTLGRTAELEKLFGSLVIKTTRNSR